MSTLKTNNIEHLDASSPSIQLDVGGGMVVAGVITATSMDLTSSDGFTVGTGASVSSPATNVLALGTNDTERVRIDSSGTIGIGTIPKTWSGYNVLQVGSASLVGQSEQDGQTTNWSNNAYYDINNNRWEYSFADEASQITQADGLIIFKTASTGTANAALSWTESARFNTSGNLAFPSGQGIDFSAASGSAAGSTSALLDDYEEGTFAPEIVPASGSFSSVTYNADTAAKYIKIGQIVHYWGTVRWTAFSEGTGSGTLRITAPFQVADRENGDDSDNVGATIVPVWTGTGDAVPTAIQAQNGLSRCILRATRHDAVSVVLLSSNVGDTGMIAFSVTYRTP